MNAQLFKNLRAQYTPAGGPKLLQQHLREQMLDAGGAVMRIDQNVGYQQSTYRSCSSPRERIGGPAQVEARPQPGYCVAARLVVSSALEDGLLQPVGEQGADGSAFLRGKNTGFSQQIFFNF